MTRTTDYVITDRGGIVENQHGVYAAVVDSSGKLLFAVGNPYRMTLVRSAAKPVQALAVLETGGFKVFGFDEADLALMCASHSSEDRHITRVQSMLAKVGAKETDLRCGGHAALSDAVNREWIKKDYSPTAVCNDCSGKHAGMLAGARALGAKIADYHLPEHPMQIKVRQVFEELCGLGEGQTRWGIDGCNLPAPAVPLNHMAKVYAAFSSAADALEADEASVDSRMRDQAHIFRAMTRYPEMVGGEGRFCTRLMAAFDGALIGKIGADGFYGVGIRSSEQTRRLGAQGGVGIAVKMEDGNLEILSTVVMEILEQLDIGSVETRQKLGDLHHPKRLNTAGVVIGQVTPAFKVRRCG